MRGARRSRERAQRVGRIHFACQRSADETSAKRAVPLCGEGGRPRHQRASPWVVGRSPTLVLKKS